MSGTDLGQVAEKDLKRVRAGHLSYLKRKIDSFNECVSTMDKRAPDKSSLEASLQLCKNSFQDFVSSHNEYIESGIDAEEKARVLTQYVEAGDRFVEVEQIAYALLRTKAASVRTHTRSLASSKVSSVQAKQRIAEAGIKLQYLKKRQAAQRQAEEAQRQAEELEAEQEVAIATKLLQIAEQAEQEDGSSTAFDQLESKHSIQGPLPTSLRPLPVKVTAAPEMATIQAMAQAIKQGPSLPKIQLMKFGGEPSEYAEFQSNFKASIEMHVDDDNERLIRLISQSTGKAADAIRSCVSLPQGTRYNAAWSILKQNFGQPHMVSQAHIKKLKEVTVRKYDAVSLLEFGRRLEDAHRTLLSLGNDYSDQLSNDDLIKSLLRKLPDESLRRRWVQKAGALLMTQPKVFFEDFVTFVKKQGNLLNNAFAEELSKPNSRTQIFKVMNLKVEEACQQCKGPHKLWNCKTFRALAIKDRHQTVKSARLCRKCLRPNHFASDCNLDIRCKSCGQPHNTLLHFEVSSSKTSINSSNRLSSSCMNSDQQATQHGVFSATAGSTGSWFKVVPVIVHGTQGPILVNAFLDNGSDTSLCTSSLLERLGLRNCQTVRYSLSTLNGEQSIYGKSANIRISSTDHTTSLVLKCLSTDRIPINTDNIAYQEDLHHYKHMRDVTLTDLDRPVDLLIGNDHADLIETQLDIRKGQSGEPIAVKTVFGWTVFGPNTRHDQLSAQVHFIKSEPEILTHLRQLYDHDFSDLIASTKKGFSPEDQQAHQIMQDSITLIDGHYQVHLPFKTDPAQLKGNYYMAKQRLLNLKKRLTRDPELKDSYKHVIQRYEAEGACSVAEDQTKENRWFLPHHPVISASKIRVVFDCAAQYRHQSLNGALLKGPDNTNPMIEILMRFRTHQVAVLADIKSMFHQVRIPPEIRSKLSFLWWQDGNLSNDPGVYEMNVHVFGATSSPSVCEFALRQIAIDNKTSHSSEATDSVLRDFYVDDWLRSFPTAEEAIHVSHEVSDLISKGGFHLTKWMSNNSDVLNSFPAEDIASDIKHVNLLESTHKTLGLLWNIQDDTIRNKMPPKDHYPATKRGVLASVASVYDPLGIISPIVLRGKLLNQRLCLSELDWDSPIPSDLHDAWLEWISDLESIDLHTVSRCVTPSFPILRTELHHFSDASQTAYGSVSYIRFIGTSGQIHCAFLFAKSRVKPSKPGITIPRLELTAATNLIAINEMISNSFAGRISIDTVTYWTDSMIVLKYIYNESKSLNIFVSNRVAKIREASNVSQWKHIKGSKNPADTASRGLSTKDTQQWRDWIQGPDFLWQEPIAYPSEEKFPSLDDDEEGVTKQKIVLSTSQKDEFWPTLFSRYSSWTKLLRLVTWLVRVKNRMRGKSPLPSSSPDIADLDAAECLIVRAVQRDSLSIKQLIKLNPFSEQGILRVGGRLQHSQLPRTAKHPAVLPAKHPVTKLLIKHYHESNGHCGAQHTLAALRQRFWIVKGCSTVRQVTRQCHTCRRQNERPGDQIMAPLPAARVSTEGSEYPFAVTGIDYFGPLYVSKARVTRSQNSPLMKRYGCIFTCLKCRAVHLELAKDLSTEAFMNVLLRFISRRGPPLVLYSDNGTNFRGAETDVLDGLKRLHQESIKRNLNSKGIEWVFNPPLASHQGGVWERLVRSVKKMLGAQLRDRIVSEEVLQTYLCEVEKILNDRPLTRVSDDSNDPDVLTPNHILLLRRNASTDFGQTTSARVTWRLACVLANEFWLRWRKEYLSLLQERQKWLHKRRNFKCGDLVLLVNTNAPRGVWLKGIVTEVFPGSDGCVREAIVRTSSGYLRRDIRKLCMLEEDLLSSSSIQ